MVPSVSTYIGDYLDNLHTNLMKDSNLNLLAQQLYQSHKEVLDFIYENRPDSASLACDYLKQKIEDEGWVAGSCSNSYVRFLSQDLDSVIPKNAKGWKNREQFVFQFYLREQNGLVEGFFSTVISPGGTTQARSMIREAIDCVSDPARKENIRARSWISQIRLKFKSNGSDDAPSDEDVVRTSIDEIWPRIQEIVAKVEVELMKAKSVLVTLKDALEE
jgi:hypothetical protein